MLGLALLVLLALIPASARGERLPATATPGRGLTIAGSATPPAARGGPVTAATGGSGTAAGAIPGPTARDIRRAARAPTIATTTRGPQAPRHRPPQRATPRPPVSHATASAGPNGTVTIAAPGPCEGSSLEPSEANLEAVRAATLCLVNRERSVQGEGPLATNTDLQEAAQAPLRKHGLGAYFEHAGPGGSFLERIMDSGYLPGPNALYSVGENIAYGSLQDATPGAIVAAWMASPGHRANILNSSFREIGIGIVPRLPASLGGGEAGAMYTEDFGVVV